MSEILQDRVIFGGHLEFLHKDQNAFIAETVQDRELFWWNFWHAGYMKHDLLLFAKNVFFSIFSLAIMNFYVKCRKKPHLSWKWCKVERFGQDFHPQGIHRVIWHFLPKSFSSHFRHSTIFVTIVFPLYLEYFACYSFLLNYNISNYLYHCFFL